MIAADIIARVDSLEPNQYDTITKLRWLSDLDGKIFVEQILTHEAPAEDIFARAEADETTGQLSWPEYTSTDAELIVGMPYGMDLYAYYLMAMVALNNAEASKYNAKMISYNNAYQEWANYYNRTHRPRRAASRFLF